MMIKYIQMEFWTLIECGDPKKNSTGIMDFDDPKVCDWKNDLERSNFASAAWDLILCGVSHTILANAPNSEQILMILPKTNNYANSGYHNLKGMSEAFYNLQKSLAEKRPRKWK